MAEPLTIELKTLTPIWTGGVDGTADRLHATGIIGSLRWWYEVIVRGLGGFACDPSEHSCLFDTKKPNDGICDVCRIFGATGWARRFRLNVIDETESAKTLNGWYVSGNEIRIQANRKYPDQYGKDRIPTWYLPGKYREGNFKLEILSADKCFDPTVIAGLVRFVSKCGALGPRPQFGFGIVAVEKAPDLAPFLAKLDSIKGQRLYSDVPSLKNMFFAELNAPSSNYQQTFNLRYDLRHLFASDKALRHFVMGTAQDTSVSLESKDGRVSTKIFVSNPYSKDNTYRMRVWSWLPDGMQKAYQGQPQTYTPYNRDNVIQQIYTELTTKYAVVNWRELNPARDKSAFTDAFAFLKDLLK